MSTAPTVQRRRKKPVEVDTLLWDGTNSDQLIAFTGSRFDTVAPEDRGEDPDITGQVFDVLHSTWVGMRTGQHVVRGVKGEYYPIDEAVLAETYDDAKPVTDAADVAAAVREFVRGLGWEVETNHRDIDDDTHSYDLYLWPAKDGE